MIYAPDYCYGKEAFIVMVLMTAASELRKRDIEASVKTTTLSFPQKARA